MRRLLTVLVTVLPALEGFARPPVSRHFSVAASLRGMQGQGNAVDHQRFLIALDLTELLA